MSSRRRWNRRCHRPPASARRGHPDVPGVRHGHTRAPGHRPEACRRSTNGLAMGVLALCARARPPAQVPRGTGSGLRPAPQGAKRGCAVIIDHADAPAPDNQQRRSRMTLHRTTGVNGVGCAGGRWVRRPPVHAWRRGGRRSPPEAELGTRPVGHRRRSFACRNIPRVPP